MSLTIVVVVVVVVIGLVTTTTTSVNRQNVDNEVITYLQKYGYLSNLKHNAQHLSFDEEEIKQAISLFQEYYQIQGDGTLNNYTLKQMRKPRCGLPDITYHEQNTERYKWTKTNLTWNFHLADTHTLTTAAFAFSLWAANSSLSFERKTLNPDILISYRGGTHTYADRKRNEEICSSSFDGPGGVLAHAFYPLNVANYTSEIHVDSAESWHIYLTEKSASNKDYLLNTLTHEIGHALGLPHSSREDSIMYAYVTASNRNKIVRLNIEDILAIQQLYGTKTPSELSTTQPPVSTTEISATKKPEYEDLCTLHETVDTVLVLHHRIFVTYRHYVWSINIDDKKHDGPHVLNSYMNFLPDNISLSAAYQRPSGELVLFANNIVYMVEYPSFQLKEGWPKRLTNLGFPPNALIDTVVNTNRGQTYAIFNNNDVAQIDECSMTVRSYHSLQAVFPGIPPAPTLAFRHMDGNLYFAKKRQFYKFNEFTRTVTEAGKFNINVLDVECSRDGLLQQMQTILSRLLRTTI